MYGFWWSLEYEFKKLNNFINDASWLFHKFMNEHIGVINKKNVS